jgi:hypothetical protein
VAIASHAPYAAPRGPAPCVAVEATGTGQDLGGGRTTATIFAGGVAIGTTTGTFTITAVEGTVASFAGPIVLTTRVGTLTAPVTGTLDLSTGDFTSTSTQVSGTRALAGVNGSLTFRGHEHLTTGAFTETVTGSPENH